MTRVVPGLTAEQLVDRLDPSDVCVSPDGLHVAFVAAPVARREEHTQSSIWLAAVDGSELARPLTAGTAEDKAPRFAPDGRTLYFLSDRQAAEEFQLYRLSLDGGEAEQITEGKPGVHAFAPLSDGRTMALLSADPGSEEDERRLRERDDAQVLGDDWRPHRLRLLDVPTREVRTLAACGDRHGAAVEPSPDGSLMAVILWESPEHDNVARECALALVDAAADRIVKEWTLPAGGTQLAWHGDGTGLVALGPVESGGQSGCGLFWIGLNEDAPRRLASDLRACPAWLAPAARPLVAVAEGLDSWLGRVDESGLERLGDFPGALEFLSANADGSLAAGVCSRSDGPPDVWAGPADGDWQRLSELAPELSEVDWGSRERLEWRASDGLELDGLLVLPHGRGRADGPFPLVTLVHGGPYGRFADELVLAWLWPAELLAAAGYACFLPNPRGGLGHGHEFAASVRGAVGVDDWGDVVAGLDRLLDEGVADPERLAIGGWSQGGFMSAWAVTQTDRFKAAVMGAGISDWRMMVAESDSPTFEATLGGSSGWEGPGRQRSDELSPVSYAARVRTPTLILHGECDERVPVGEGRYFARALRAFGVPFELVIYPREGHLIRERNHLLDLAGRWLAWLERWLGPGLTV